jgi:hypothetical protein
VTANATLRPPPPPARPCGAKADVTIGAGQDVDHIEDGHHRGATAWKVLRNTTTFPEPAVEIVIVIDPAPFRLGAGSDVYGCGDTTRSTG